MNDQIKGVNFKKLRIIDIPEGNVYHALKKSDSEFEGFGEAYFSSIHHKEIKAWKKHRIMKMNLIVPVGEVKFVFMNQKNQFLELITGEDNYGRITVDPDIWFGFQGISKKTSLILNISNIIHSPDEADKVDMLDIKYNWN